MNALSHPLWQRIAAFSLDRPDATLTFTARLARDNGWSRGFARRVVEEYKRFMFLAVVADHVVTPSEAVDQAWHLHLTYTRSYWSEFCDEVLDKKIHHDPTTGIAEQPRFVNLYEQTQRTYEHWFGQAPPADIWPDAVTRFGEDADNRWVNTTRHWVIPKPRWLKNLKPRLLCGGIVGVATAPTVFVFGHANNDFARDFVKVVAVVLVIAFFSMLLFARKPRNGHRRSNRRGNGFGTNGDAAGAAGFGAGMWAASGWFGDCDSAGSDSSDGGGSDCGGGDSGGDGCGGSGCGAGCGAGCGGGCGGA